MYLSRLWLNALNRSVQRDLADCHQMHRTIMRAFPAVQDGTDARGQFGVLYRTELGRQAPPSVLVQSAIAPDWSGLPPGYLAPGRPAESRPAAALLYSLAAGQNFRFRLCANPTRKISVDDSSRPEGYRPTRVELRGEDEWLAWLARKGSQCGFTVLAAVVRRSGDGRLTGVRSNSEPSGGTRRDRVTVFSVLFEGRLQLIDPEASKQALVHGIGPGKAYGCGLLSLAREA